MEKVERRMKKPWYRNLAQARLERFVAAGKATGIPFLPTPTGGPAPAKAKAKTPPKDVRVKKGEALGRANLPIGPDTLRKMVLVGVFHAEAGTRKFKDWTKMMLRDFGEIVRKQLKLIYNAMRHIAGFDSSVLDSYSTVTAEYEKIKAAPATNASPTVRPVEPPVNEGKPDHPRRGQDVPGTTGGGRDGGGQGSSSVSSQAAPGSANPQRPDGPHPGAKFGWPKRPGIRTASPGGTLFTQQNPQPQTMITDPKAEIQSKLTDLAEKLEADPDNEVLLSEWQHFRGELAKFEAPPPNAPQPDPAAPTPATFTEKTKAVTPAAPTARPSVLDNLSSEDCAEVEKLWAEMKALFATNNPEAKTKSIQTSTEQVKRTSCGQNLGKGGRTRT